MGRRIRYRPSMAQEQIPSLGRARGDTFWTPKTILTIGVIWVLVLAVLAGVGYYMIQNRKFRQEFAPMVDVCRGKWVGAASTYSATPGRHPGVAVISTSGGWQLDSSLIPGEVLARSVAETQMVLCLGRVQEILIESCPYTNEDHTERYALERYYLKQEARLVEAKTGRVVTVQTFTGKSPIRCQKTEWFSDSEPIVKSVGTEVSSGEIRGWVSSHLYIK